MPRPSARRPTRIDAVTRSRLTAAARNHLYALELEHEQHERVLAIAARFACAEIEVEHIEVGVVVDAARRERDLTSAA